MQQSLPARPSMQIIGPGDLLDHLPSPCIYINNDRIITYANKAAQDITHATEGHSIDSIVDVRTTIDELSRGKRDSSGSRKPRTIPVQTRQMTWNVTQTIIHSQTLYCLLGSSRDDAALLSKIVRPSFEDVDHAVTLVTHDFSTKIVNARGQTLLEETAQAIESSNSISKTFGPWSEDFTRQLPLSASAAAVAYNSGKSHISIKRGIENPHTGVRTVLDTTVTLLDHPSGGLLGCIVQMRPAEEWGEYLKRYDINNTISSSVMVRTMLLDGTIDFVCATAETFFKQNRKELCENWYRYVHPQDLPKLQQAVATCLATGVKEDCEVRYLKGTSYRYFLDRIAPFKIDGEITRWYCISTDIHLAVTQRRQANQARDRLFNFMHDMDVNVFEVDSDYIFRSCEGNISVDLDTEVSVPVTIFAGKTLDESLQMVDPHETSGLRPAFIAVMEGRSSKSMIEYKIGEKHMQTTIVPMRADTAADGTTTINGIFGITLDVSAQFEHQQATVKLEAMAESSRLKDEFVANVSHELRTPIAGLTGLLELLLETDLTEQQHTLVSGLNTSSVALARIVNDILDFSKAEANAVVLESRPFDLSQLLLEVKTAHETVAEKKGLSMQTDLPLEPLTLLGDALRLRQIIDNLLSNAVKFTEHGQVRLSASYERTRSGITTSITIQDTGPGMDDETLRKLFQPFVQADQSTTRLYGGTGLGLSIARKLARAMGGEVSLSSTPGSGATSTLQLPFEWAKSKVPQEATIREVNTEDIQDRQILVVEDNPVNLTVINGHLRKLGVKQILSASNGREAVSLITSSTRLPDLVFMDCQMPVLDGFDTTRLLRSSIQFNKPIIALTASATTGYRQKCIDAGMDDYVTKPFTRKQLLETMMSWLDRRSSHADDDYQPP